MEKIKNYLRKTMFERIDGIDIENLKTSELLRQVKLLPVLFIITTVCAVLITAFGAFFAFVSDSDLALCSLFFFAFALVAIFLSFIFPKRLKNVKSALNTREITDDDKKNAEQKINSTKKAAIIGIIIYVIFMGIGICGMFGNTAEFSDNQCQICEREFKDSKNKKSIAETNMCKNCYDNYKSLEWVLDE